MTNFKKLIAVFLSCLIVFSSVLPMNPIEVDAATNQIKDISTTNAKYKPAKWAVDNNYFQLFPGGKFQPDTPVKEWEVLQMIAKLDGNYQFKSYEKDMIYSYYGELNIPLYGVGIVSKQNATISRSHFARIFAAMNGLDLSEKQAIQYLYMSEITTGTTGKRTFEDYKPTSNLNRGDLAVFMYRMNQQGKIALEGLTSKATGKDDHKITLPADFIENADGSVILKPKPGENTDDKVNRPSVYKAVESINVASEKLIANGVDSTLITIQLKDSYGNPIPYDESLAFKVTSEAGASFSATDSSTSGKAKVVYTDGPELNVFVTAPALTKSYVDKIRFELVNNDDPKYYTYKNQVIEASVRYVPEAELRISYEVFDPDQPDWTGGNVDPGVKPLPALPEGVIDGKTVPFSVNGVITVSDYDEDLKLMTGSKYETYNHPTTGKPIQGEITSKEIQYGNAELKLEGQVISVWLFEQILEYMIYGNEKNPNGWGGVGSAKVMYTLNKEGRATYDLQGVMSEEHTSQFDSTLHAAIIYLINFLPKADDITLAHEESVLAIKALYDKLSQIDKNILQKGFAQAIGKLEGALSKIEVLKKGQELEERPEGMDRYTKVIVNVVAPSGVVITDYRGTVEVTFNGTSRTVAFDTNTKDYNTGTGYAGSAVVYFDDIVYGKSPVTAKLVDKDPRYAKALQGLDNKTATSEIFANPKFEKNICKGKAEVAFVVDHSGSVRKNDPNNDTAKKVKQVINQLAQDTNHVYHFNRKPYHEKSGTASDVTKIPSLLEYQYESNATNIADAVDIAINKFSNNQQTAKALVLVTDGKTSKSKIDKITQLAKDKNVKVYTVAIGKYNTINETLLKTLSTDTGGAYFNSETIYNIHGSFQAIINSILCNKEVVDNSCAVGDTLFNEASVNISRTNVILNARINQNCTNVSAVSVIFTASGGSVTYDLQSRGASIFRLTRYVNEFKPFNLYNDVEFQAFDQAGKLIAAKSVKIQ
ncbi:sortase [Solibacillus sp. R5-41]|uniref:VWA domain-containing protein n=1 Tax=Solibacillus sp. R5-41 TaxID=2048654 RepID=UPI000C12652F|nr:VWA domain-containing protein [Solibacillus sp. R5-41]ATP41294.1 sortase [Solibacillus sp. R5-41]